MAIYEYLCDDCKKIFTLIQLISEHDETNKAPKCPECGGSNTHQLFSTFFPKTSTKS